MRDERQRPGARSARAIEMSKVLQELEQSGLGVAAFARQCGIPVSTLQWWRSARQVRGGGGGRQSKRLPGRGRPRGLVEVVGSSRRDGEGLRRSLGVFEVELASGRTVRVPAGFDAEALGRLVRVLEAPC